MSTRRRIQLAVLTLAAFGLCWAVAWYVVRDRVHQSDEYLLTADRVDLTPLPPWIHSDIKTEVLGSASLDGPLSILDPQLTQRLHDAFPLHPWVEQVIKVSKQYPARVKVELVYRRPVCMVEVPGGLFAVSDIVVQGEMDPQLRQDMESWAGCVAGALEEQDYLARLAAAGFVDASIEVTKSYDGAEVGCGCGDGGSVGDGRIVSGFVRAHKA